MEAKIFPGQRLAAEKEIVVTDEYWYSNKLRLNLVVKHSDLRTGTVKITVAQITRTEPNPSFFEIPDGYKPANGTSISKLPGRFRGRLQVVSIRKNKTRFVENPLSHLHLVNLLG